MKVKDIKVGQWYEARVPIRGSATERARFRPVFVTVVANSAPDGDMPLVAVVYETPLTSLGRSVALISPTKIRLPRQRMVKNEGVASPPEA